MEDKNLQFKDLPEEVKDELLSEAALEANTKIIKEFNLSEDQIDRFFEILRQIILKQTPTANLLFSLSRLNLEEEKKKKMASEIVKLRLLPIKDYLKTNFVTLLEELGENITEYPELLKVEEPIDLKQLIGKINKEAGLSFPDEVLAKRFETIILSYLKDVRDEIGLREVLERSEKIGGLGLVSEKIEQVVKILEREKPRVKLEVKPEEKPSLAEGVKAPQEMVAKVSELKLEKPVPLPPAQEIKKEEIKKEVIAPPKLEVLEIVPEEKQVAKFEKGTLVPPLEPLKIEPEIKPEEKPLAPKKPSEEKPVKETGLPFPPRPAFEEVKEKVEEIKPRIRVLGPIEELKFMSLEHWRRLGDVRGASLRIEEKINLLAEESLIKKDEAIKAWKNSEVNLLYLEIGRESLETNASVKAVIEKREKEGKPFLILEEFEAVAELNQRLRF